MKNQQQNASVFRVDPDVSHYTVIGNEISKICLNAFLIDDFFLSFFFFFFVSSWLKCKNEGTLLKRKKFHFSEVHGSMNATDHVQSKWCPKGFTLTLHGTRCVHTSINLRKIKFISYIYTLYLHRFCSLFVIFYFNLANKRRRNLYSDVFGYYFQQPSPWHNVNRTLRRTINFCVYLWRRLRVMSRERVSFISGYPY